MTRKPAQNEKDKAWVTIKTPFDAAQLRLFLDDIERLYRINPYLVFSEWESTGKGRFRFKAQNLSNQGQIDTSLNVTSTADAVTVKYSDGLKTATTFRIDAQSNGTADLVITDDYSGTPLATREARLNEVDTSLLQWASSLHRYLWRWKRWSWLPGWKFYMRRIWQPMKPMARRIVFFLIVITAIEFVLFLFVFTIFWLEIDKFL